MTQAVSQQRLFVLKSSLHFFLYRHILVWCQNFLDIRYSFIFEVCLQSLMSETHDLDSGAELSFVPQVQSGEVHL